VTAVLQLTGKGVFSLSHNHLQHIPSKTTSFPRLCLAAHSAGMSDPSIIPLDSAQESLDKADAEGKEEPEPPISSPPSSPHFSRSLSSANFSPNGDLYDGLDEDWLLSTDVGELSLFDFLDSLSFIPVTLDKFNQRIKLQSREVRVIRSPSMSKLTYLDPQ